VQAPEKTRTFFSDEVWSSSCVSSFLYSAPMSVMSICRFLTGYQWAGPMAW
jgi:hypothetical protein